MARIRSGTILIEPPFKNYPSLLRLAEYLVKKGVSRVVLLLEAAVVDVRYSDRVMSVAVPPLTMVVEHDSVDQREVESICQGSCRIYEVERDAWAETALIDSAMMLEFLRVLSLQPGTRLNINGIEIALFEAPSCRHPTIIETLALKYPVTGLHGDVEPWFSGKIFRIARKPGEIPLMVCVNGDLRVLALLDTSQGRTLYIKPPSTDPEYSAAVQVLLDVLAYLEKGVGVPHRSLEAFE